MIPRQVIYYGSYREYVLIAELIGASLRSHSDIILDPLRIGTYVINVGDTIEIHDGLVSPILRVIHTSSDQQSHHRNHNVGSSDYATRKIQPWDIWREYKLDPWRADIVKRILRDKEGEDPILDLEKNTTYL